MNSRIYLFLLFATCAALVKFSAVSGASAKEPIDDNEMGMSVLFEMVNFFLGDIVHKEKISDSFINLTNVFVDGEVNNTTVENWKEWLKYLIGFSVCVAIAALFIVVMPIAGICFCCCRCCGKCGGKKKKHETKFSKCKRRTYCTFLVIFNTLALAGVVCAFICNSLISKRLENDNNNGFVGYLNSSLNHVTNYIDNAVTDVNHVLFQRINSSAQEILDDIDAASIRSVDDVLSTLNATEYLSQAKDISNDVNKTKDNLDQVADLLNDLSAGSKELRDNLTSIKDSIQSACVNTECEGFDPSAYNTEANFTTLDNLSNQTRNVSKALDLNKYIKEAESSIASAKANVKSSIDNIVSDVQKAVSDLTATVKVGMDDLLAKKEQALNFLPQAYKDLNSINNDLKDNKPYVFYVGIGLCCLYLLIVVLYYTGILFGLSGERPGEDAPCCNTGVGASFLLAGVGFTFIFAWILMLICTIMFVIGGPMYTEICRYFDGHNPSALKPFDVVISNTIFKNESFEFSLSASLKKCQENQAIYTALDLNQIVDLKSITNLTSLRSQLNRLDSINIDLTKIKIISPNLEKKLREFADAGLDNINFSEYYRELQVLNKKLTKQNLTELANQLDSSTLKATQKKNADRLRKLNDDVVHLDQKVEELNRTLVMVQRTSTFKPAVMKLISGLTTAQDTWQTRSSDLVKEQIKNLSNMIYSNITDNVDKLIKTITTDTAQCKPLTVALYSLSDSVCILMLDPLNGMWFSFGWCLFFFVLCLIFAILLSGEYRCEHKYEKDFDDPSYAMYGGGNQDTIPLTRGRQEDFKY